MNKSSHHVPHALDVIKIVNRCKVGQQLVFEKILQECVQCVLSAAKKGQATVTFCVPCFKPGYPAYNVDEVKYYVLHQLLMKKYMAVPYNRNLIFISWNSPNQATVQRRH